MFKMVECVLHEHQVAGHWKSEAVFIPDDRMDVRMPFCDRLYMAEQLGVDIDSKHFPGLTDRLGKRASVMPASGTDVCDHGSRFDVQVLQNECGIFFLRHD